MHARFSTTTIRALALSSVLALGAVFPAGSTQADEFSGNCGSVAIDHADGTLAGAAALVLDHADGTRLGTPALTVERADGTLIGAATPTIDLADGTLAGAALHIDKDTRVIEPVSSSEGSARISVDKADAVLTCSR